MHATLATLPSQGPGSAGLAGRGQASGARAAQGDITYLTEARDKLATLLAGGEMWALPLFTRLEAELAELEAREDVLARARQIAEMAARKAA
ncbi:hypothetical protein [Poseidonocella sedimentorum]|uniref:Uncharacterized protein n=2 Tax=Poseidonocella TaxID=1158296 RepID=A0A1I6E199_9RHOB|nr:hypothetical protein [Poseidonocella sedimentorum]SFR11529.1 hypothetical protein SAMN04515673_106216 [Poseidonocella sedimentorum]